LASEDDEEAQERRNADWKYRLVPYLWGMNKFGVRLNWGIVILSLINFWTYIQMTEWRAQKIEFAEAMDRFLEEAGPHPGSYTNYAIVTFGLRADILDCLVGVISTLAFTFLAGTRLVVVRSHPDWEDFGRSAPWRYAFANVFMLLELISLAVTWYSFMQKILHGAPDHANLCWVHVARSLEMLEHSGCGLGVRALKQMIDDEGRLLLTSYVLALIIWLVLSSLYFVSNIDNENLRWEAAAFDGRMWDRFESIPSTAFFCLINLVKEHPLADRFTTFWARLWVDVSVLVAMPLFALATSVLQYALFPHDGDEEETHRSWLPDEENDLTRSRTRNKLYLTAALAFVSIERFFTYTARHKHYASYFGLEWTKCCAFSLACVDGAVAVCFLAEFALRWGRQGKRYMKTGLAYVDIVAWLPGLMHLALFVALGEEAFANSQAAEWLRACCVLRIFKLERFLRSCTDLFDIMSQRRSIVGATLLLCMLTWMVFSNLLYILERENPDDDVRENYSSVMRSLWSELINLSGEYPWADYTPSGRPVMMFIGLFSVIIFCIPTSIFSDGFRERLDRDVGDNAVAIFDSMPWQASCRPEKPGFKREVYDMYFQHLFPDDQPKGRTMPFLALRAANVIVVAMSTFVTVMGTLSDDNFCTAGMTKCEGAAMFRWWATAIDSVTLVFFIFDYFLRNVALGGRHALSTIGLCDLLSLLALAISLPEGIRTRAFSPVWDARYYGERMLNLIVPLRLLRLFSLESYFLGGHVLRNVFYAYRWPVVRAGGALLNLWFVHATLLYLIERPGGLADYLGQSLSNPEAEADAKVWTMKKRYGDIPLSLQYSILHLFGDFPQVDYTFWSKMVHFVGILYGIGIDAAFIGVVSCGFARYLAEERRKRSRRLAVQRLILAVRVITRVQGWYRRRKARIAAINALPDATSRLRLLRVSRPRPPSGLWHGIVLGAREIHIGKEWGAGKLVRDFFHCMLIVNLVITMALSMPEFELEEFRSWEQFALAGEFVCSLCFLAEYVIAIIAAPARALSFFRVVDFFCLWPGFALCYVNAFHNQHRLWGRMEALAMCRAVRILDFGVFQKEVRFVRQALGASVRLLATPTYIAFNLWITSSALFMFLENLEDDADPDGQATIMTSVPATMYWCCILLIGEWVVCDFTYAGSRLAIFYVLFGIALFAIPTGVMIEEIRAYMLMANEERRSMKDVMRKAEKEEREAEERAEIELQKVTAGLHTSSAFREKF